MPKKSSLLRTPLCSSNVRVCFHTMRSVSTVRNTFLKSSLSILFRLLHFPVPRFPPLHFCYSRVFQSRVFSAPEITPKRYEIGCQLLLITNRKSHTGFRLVPTSMTLNDLERKPLFCVFSRNSTDFQADYMTVVKDRPIMSVKYCLPVLVFYFWRKL